MKAGTINQSSLNTGLTKFEEAYESMTSEERANACLIVSAHSLPEKILANGDPYADQFNETADLIAEAAGIEKL